MADVPEDIEELDDETAADDNEVIDLDDLSEQQATTEILDDAGDEFGGGLDALLTPSVRERPWMAEVKMHLVSSVEMLKRVVDECIASGVYAVDAETTGLDNRIFRGMTRDRIVGIGVSPDGKTGYYTPIRHRQKDGSASPHNLPRAGAYAEFRRLFASAATPVFHNGKFDQEFFEFPDDGLGPLGTFDKPSKWHDSLILAYLANSRIKDKKLKHLAKSILGCEMIELDELFNVLLGDKTKKGKAGEYHGPKNFALLDPSLPDVLWYACGDVIFTFRLHKHYLPLVVDPDQFGHKQSGIYTIEKGCVAATRWMERNRIFIDRPKVAELILLGQKEMYEALCDVYDSASTILGRDIAPAYFKALRTVAVIDNPDNLLQTQMDRLRKDRTIPQDPVETTLDAKGRPKEAIVRVPGKDGKPRPIIYDVLSPPQLGEMLEEMGVQGLTKTEKSKQVNTSKKVLDKIIEAYKDTLPFMKKVRRFREVLKALSSYLVPLYSDIDTEDHTARVSFNAHKVDTGRFSTPAKEAADDAVAIKSAMNGWPNINLQSLPATYDKKRPECLLRLRECVKARRPGWYIVAIDYSGVELRLVTNLSREPMWMTEFFRCADCGRTFDRGDGTFTPMPAPSFCPQCGSDKIGDLHTLTGLSVYGKEARSDPNWKKLRGNAKSCNFALCYGGGGKAASRATGCDDNEGWRIKRQFDGTYTTLARWWKGQHKLARERGYVLTAFGRKYPVPDILLPRRDPQTGRENGAFIAKAERNSVNGPIQGTSADVTKTAMTLIYKEFQQRGWLDKAMMIITMHDELVFEVHGSILEEFIGVTIPLMTRFDLLLSRKWPIPLTCDVEMGETWDVAWDLKELRHKREWPEELAPLFTEAQTGTVLAIPQIASRAAAPAPVPVSPAPAPEEPRNPPEPGPAPAPEEPVAVETPAEASAPVEAQPPAPTAEEPPRERPADGDALADLVDDTAAPAPQPPKTEPAPQVAPKPQATSPGPAKAAAPGTPFVYRLQCDLTTVTLFELARVIRTCRGKGFQPLRVEAKDGTPLEGWSKDAVLVNGDQFFWAAHEARL